MLPMALPSAEEQGRKPEKPKEKSLLSSISIPKSLQWEYHEPGTPISPGREPDSLRRRASSLRGPDYRPGSPATRQRTISGYSSYSATSPSSPYSHRRFGPHPGLGYPATQTIQVLLNLPLCLQINAEDLTCPPAFSEVEATLKGTFQYLYDGINTLIHRTTTNNDGLLWRDFLDAYSAIPWLEGILLQNYLTLPESYHKPTITLDARPRQLIGDMVAYMAYRARYREVLLLTAEELVSGKVLSSYLRNQKDLLREPLRNDHVAIMVDTWQHLMRTVEFSGEFNSGVVWGKTTGAGILSALQGVMECTQLPELVNLQVELRELVVECIMILEPQFGYGYRDDELVNDEDFEVMYHFQKADIWIQTERMLLSLVAALESALSPEDPSSDEELESLFINVRNEYHALVKCLCDITNPGLELDMDFLPLMRIVATVPRIAHAKAVTFVRILREMDLAIRKASASSEANSEPRYLLKRHIRLVADHLVKLSQEAGRFKSRPSFDLDAVSDGPLGIYLSRSESGDELSPEIAGVLRMGETLLGPERALEFSRWFSDACRQDYEVYRAGVDRIHGSLAE